MNKAMKELKARAAGMIRNEKKYSTKAEAKAAALKLCHNLDSNISVWETPDGEFAVIQHENREWAGLCDYKEVIDTGELYDTVKARKSIDEIEEV